MAQSFKRETNPVETSMLSAKLCTPCLLVDEHNEALKWCNNCKIYLCEHCSKRHLIGAHSGHGLVNSDISTEEEILGKLSISDKCKTHPKEVISMYCLNENTAGCNLCAIVDHSECHMVAIDNLSQKSENREVILPLNDILKDVLSLQGSVKSNMRLKQNFHDQKLSELSMMKEKLIRKIDQLFSESQKSVEIDIKNEKAMSEMVVFMAEELIKLLNVLINNQNKLANVSSTTFLCLQIRLIENLCHMTKRVDDYQKCFPLKSFELNYVEHLQQVLNLDQPVEFKENKESSDSLENDVKNIIQHKDNIISEVVPLPSTQVVKAHPWICRNATFKKELLTSTIGKSFINGCLLNNGTFLFVDYNNKCLCFVNEVFELYESKSIDYQPFGCFVTADNKSVWITYPDHSNVKNYNLADFSVVRNLSIQYPSGIVYLSDGDLIVGCTDSIQKVGSSGHTNSKVEKGNSHNPPTYVCLSPDGKVVYHKDQNDIVGRQVSDFKEVSRWNHEKLTDPFGLTCDPDGNVYVVGNLSNNLVQFSADGQQKRVLIDKFHSIRYPYSVHFNKDASMLVVTSADGRCSLEVYDFSK